MENFSFCAVIEKWKQLYPYVFTYDMKIICKSCKWQEGKLRLMLMANLTFLVGSTNNPQSTLKEHNGTECPSETST